MNQLQLDGVEGANPLGFLAALGVLQALDDAWPSRSTKLHWTKSDGGWRPVVSSITALSQDKLLESLAQVLSAPGATTPFTLSRSLNVAPERFRLFAKQRAAEATRENRRGVDFVSAFGCEITSSEGVIQDTAFRTMSGAGHQHFLDFMSQLVSQTTRDHLDAALFRPWVYGDPGPSLRWDPADDRRYAMRWHEPSGDPIKTVRGANRLAVEGLRLYPTAPTGQRLATTGFSGTTSRDTYWTWPIWDVPIPIDVIRSLVALAELQEAVVRRDKLAARGIAEVYRSQRLTIGKYRNFSPARPA